MLGVRALIKRLFRRKRGQVVEFIDDSNATHTLFDLLCIGVGATAGSGVFVVTGLVARRMAGPAVVVSWILAGVSCLLSALSFAELSATIPSPGSAYSFVYSTIGELPAFLAASCLTLECGVSAAAVARNWGNKFETFLSLMLMKTHQDREKMLTLAEQSEDSGFSIPGAVLMILTMFLFLSGTETSKSVLNAFTILKLLIILFMIIVGLYLYQPSHFDPFVPLGWSGVFRGSTCCFFGFVGFDEVCVLAMETKDPRRTLPLAVLGTVGIVMFLYVLASLALVGMQQYDEIDSQSGFSVALYSHKWTVAGDCAALGELLTLPLVCLASFLPQPRILVALAKDNLLPSTLHSLRASTALSGVVCCAIALVTPFSALDEIISAGALLVFSLTNCALILLRLDDEVTHLATLQKRRREKADLPSPTLKRTFSLPLILSMSIFEDLSPCKKYLLVFNLVCVATISLTQRILEWSIVGAAIVAAVGCLLLLWLTIALFHNCPDIVFSKYNDEIQLNVDTKTTSTCNRSDREGLTEEVTIDGDEVCVRDDVVEIRPRFLSLDFEVKGDDDSFERESDRRRERLLFNVQSAGIFRVPGVPFIPLAGIVVNHFLVCQISSAGVITLLVFFVLVVLFYLCQIQSWRDADNTRQGKRYFPLSHSTDNCGDRTISVDTNFESQSYGALSPLHVDS
jgi:amino acid transporter